MRRTSSKMQGKRDTGKAKADDEVRELMSGNICRCGAYPNILAAIKQAMQAAESEVQR